MGKSKLKIETRLKVLEMATEVAAGAAENTNVMWMIEFQEELVERLYRKMVALLEEEGSDSGRRKEKGNAEADKAVEQ